MNSSTKPVPPALFSDLSLAPAVLKAVMDLGYETPSPIQAQAIPCLLQGRDVLGVAQTGTGKTAAFALPLLTLLEKSSGTPAVLCLVPTRELAIQVAEAFQSYARHMRHFHVLPIYGGADPRAQVRQLRRGVQVVVGTPGRVMDHMRRGALKLDGLRCLVLDEADEMLRMGFIDDVTWILEQMPEGHQTALFSATMPPAIKKITQRYLHNPDEITIRQKTTTAENIEQHYLMARNNEKLDLLTRVLEVEDVDAVLIFVRTKNATLEVAEKLKARGYAVEPLNGDIAQNQREKVVGQLKKGQIDLLVATDVAARGLDVSRISHVINLDVPYDTESYVHRIGRTGRAGRSGTAILFINGREKRMLHAIERVTRQNIKSYRFPSAEALNERKLKQTFARLDAVLGRDVSDYEEVMRQYLAQNELDPIRLAAIMASLEAEGKPFFHKDKPENKRKYDHDREQDKKPRAERQEPREKRAKGVQAEDDVAMEWYRFEVGTEHGVEKGDLVGAVANETGMDASLIGKIRLFADHSMVALPEGMPKDIYKHLRKVWLRGRQLNLSRVASEEAANADQPTARFQRRSGKSRAGKRRSA